ncbi:phage tail tape measure protein [Ancrocorticia populi]|uniref:phage tail tape measure protein n=1 Tax=Ancrocorticia populi TaxID=2175228 RepID=UPI003F9A6AB1
MAAVGYATLPIIPSLDGIAKKLSASFEAPAAKSAAKAAQSIEQAMSAAAEKSAFALEKAREREQEATQKVLDLEKKVQAERDNSERKQQAIAAAELARDRQISDSKAKVVDAERKLDQARESGKASVEEIAELERRVETASLSAAETKIKAEGRVESAIDAHRKALDKVESANRAYGDAQENAAEKSEKVLTAQKRLDTQTSLTTKEFKAQQAGAQELSGELGSVEGSSGKLGSAFEALKGKIAPLAGAVGFGALATQGFEVQKALDSMDRQLGLTGESAGLFNEEVYSALKGGVAANVDDATGAIGALNSQFRYLGSEGEQTASQLSDNFLAFSKTFDVDMPEAVQTAGQLIVNGLAPDVESAADLMTTAMQRVPAQMRDELPEIINEYGTNFRSLGFSGEEAFGILVNQAEKGKWALDKTGDALKEFSIRASDGSKSTAEAYAFLGEDAESMATSVAAGGESARLALQYTAEKLLDVEDPAQRAQQAIALFGTPLEDLSVDQIPQFLEGLSGAEGAMAGAAGASQAMADQMSSSLEGRMNTLKGTVSSLASEGFMKLWDAGEKVAGWAKDNGAWLGPLAAAVGAAAGAWALWTGAIKAWQTATKIATGLQVAFNAVMAANPIMLAAMAIAALVAGLVVFFTKTETGKKAWEAFTKGIGDAWDWVKEKLSAGFDALKSGWESVSNAFMSVWDSVLKPVFDAVWQVAQTTIAVIGTIILAPLLIAWNALSWGISAAWENIIKPAWDALAAAGQWMWDSVLSPVFGWISAGWQALADGMSWVWNNVILVAWTALQDAANWMWANVLMPVFNAISAAWQVLGDGVRWVYDTIIKPAWDALAAALNWLYSSVVQPVLQWIRDRWTDMGNALNAGYVWIKDTVFAGLSSALDWLKGVFQAAVDGIGTIWDGLKAAAAKPVKFVIDTVWNNGILAAWNKIADFLPGIDTKEPYTPAWLGNYAKGTASIVPGARSVGRDNMEFVSRDGRYGIGLAGGEGIAHQSVVDGLGGKRGWDHLNKVGRVRGPNAVRAALAPVSKENDSSAVRHLGHFAVGGIVEAMTSIVQQKYPMLTMTSGYDNRPGLHGMGMAADFSNGTGNTPAQLALAQDIATTYPNSMELIYDSPGWSGNIKNGANVGAFGQFYTMDQAGPHYHHVHWGMNTPPTMPFGGGVFEGGSSGGGAGGGLMNWFSSKARGIWDDLVSPITKKIDEAIGGFGDTAFAKIPASMFEKVKDAAWSKISSLIPSTGGSGPNSPWEPSAGAEQWRQMLIDAYKNQGYEPTQAKIDAWVRQIDSESGGDPNIAQQIVDVNGTGEAAGVGLGQMIPGTWAAYRDPSLPDNRRDPWAMTNAMVRYGERKYGDGLLGVIGHGHGYHKGGLAGEGQGWLQKTAMEPEMVLNPEMTRAFVKWMNVSPESLRVVAEEFTAAFQGGDWGYGETASYIGNSSAKRLLDEVSWMGAAWDEISAAFDGIDFGLAATARYLGGNEKLAGQILDEVERIGRITAPVRDFIKEQMKYSWEDRMGMLADHMAGITVNDKGEREQTRGRIGTPEEIAQWAGTELGYGLLGEAAGLVGLEGIVPDKPKFLDDDLRVPFTKDSQATAATMDTPVESVADQATATTPGTVILKGDAFDAASVKKMLEELGHKVEQQGEDIADIKDERAAPGTLARSI